MKWPKEFVAARILLCVLELIVGILLWIDPAGFATGIFVVGGVLLMLLGVVQIVQYFRLSPEEAFFRQPYAFIIMARLQNFLGNQIIFQNRQFVFLDHNLVLSSLSKLKYSKLLLP